MWSALETIARSSGGRSRSLAAMWSAIGLERHHGAVFGKGKPAGRHLVQHDAETPDVAAGVQVEAARLLRRHVARSADHHPRPRARFHIDHGRRRHARELGEPEVEDLRIAVGTHHDVLGLDVPMHQAAGMRRRQRTRHLDADVHDVAHRQGALPQAVPQRLALDELGHDVGAAVQLAEVVHDHDVGVVQARRGPRFLTEPSYRSASAASSGERNLSATGRSSFASWAR